MFGGVITHFSLDGSWVALTSAGFPADFENLFEDSFMESRNLLRGEKNRR